MNKFIISLLSLLTVLITYSGQASDIEENPPKERIITLPPFDHELVPAELPFIERCKYKGIRVNWEYTRRSFLMVVRYSRDHFESEVRENLHIDYDKLEELGLQDLYDQYKDFYNNWYGLSSEQKEDKEPVVSTASSCSSSSSSSSLTSTTSSAAVEDDHDEGAAFCSDTVITSTPPHDWQLNYSCTVKSFLLP